MDAIVEAPKAKHSPEQRIRLLWPALATAIAFPVLMAIASVFLLWSVHVWNTPAWVSLLSVILLTAVGLYATWRLMLAWAKRNFQFSLRGMLIAMSILAITIGAVSHQLHQRMRLSQAVLNVAENGGYPEHWNFEDENWLEANFGYDPFEEVISITVRVDTAVPSLLHNSDAFPELQQLSFLSKTTDASLKYAAEFNKFPNLIYGAFYNTKMTDSGMKLLEDWTRVRSLFFNEGSFTDKGLTHIGKMANLKKLHLINIPITDAGLTNLQDLTNLERLLIRRTKVTGNGFRSLCKALPNCYVTSEFGSFPIPEQVRQISVWKDYPEKQQLLTISVPAQIAVILVGLEKFVGQHKGGWKREWDSDTQDRILLEIKGPNRLLCRPSFGEGFFQSASGSYCPLSSSDVKELRQVLGIDTTE